MKVLFYGNCNVTNLIEPDERGSRIFDRIESDHTCVSYMCHSERLDESMLDGDIKTADLIITQPIDDNYRGKPNLSTRYLLNERKSDTPVIIFPPIWFDAYYLDYTGLHINGKAVTEPENAHLGGIYQCWKNKQDAADFVNNYVNNPDLFSAKQFNEKARQNIESTATRENKCKEYASLHNEVYPVNLTPFYKDEYKTTLLTYTWNHPSKATLLKVATMIREIVNSISIGSEINLNANHNADTFDSHRWIIYSSIQKSVDFAASLHPPSIRRTDGSTADINFLFNSYCKVYDKL